MYAFLHTFKNAYILTKNQESNYYKVSFLHPSKGQSKSFCYPKPRPDILDIPLDDILKRVDPCTTAGRTYTLTQEEMASSSTVLDKKNLNCHFQNMINMKVEVEWV